MQHRTTAGSPARTSCPAWCARDHDAEAQQLREDWERAAAAVQRMTPRTRPRSPRAAADYCGEDMLVHERVVGRILERVPDGREAVLSVIVQAAQDGPWEVQVLYGPYDPGQVPLEALSAAQAVQLAALLQRAAAVLSNEVAA